MADPIALPWPDRVLSPNWRGHWAVKANAVKRARSHAGWMAKAAGWRALPPQVLPVTITFHPPDRRGRDTDNALSALKGALDGISSVIGIDDRHWRLTLNWGEPVKNGRVIVEPKPLVSLVELRGTIG